MGYYFKKYFKVLICLICLFILTSCGKKSYAFFNYNCNGTDYHKCELKNNKLNCLYETPTCDGYTFKGWYKANEYVNQVDLHSDFINNEIIYARWDKIIEEPDPIKEPDPIEEPEPIEEPSLIEENNTYKISFNANGGKGGQSKPLNVEYNGKLPTISQTKPTRSGYTFIGWYDSKVGGTQYYNSSNMPLRKYNKKSNTTLYAQWNANEYMISFNANGGKGGQSASIMAIYNDDLPTINQTKPTRSGYEFIGWYDSKVGGTQYYNSSNTAVRKYDKKSDTTLYAQWNENPYVISFNTNGGKGGQSGSLNVKYNEELPTINQTKPTRTGYEFMGWYDSITDGTQYYNSSNIAVRKYDKKSNTTLYAHWNANTYTIVYNANGGSGAPVTQSYVYSESGTIQLSTIIPTRSGYTFLGWSQSNTASSATYKSGQSLSKSDARNYLLYAVWKKNEKLKIYFLSIGRYDGFLIMGNGTTIFIDGGYVSQGKKCVDFLKEIGVTKIDALIGSHLHDNHIDAHRVLIDNFEIGRAYYGDDPRTCKKRHTCSDDSVSPSTLNKKLENIPVTILSPGFNIKIGNLTFDILAPKTLHDDPNRNSLHMILKYGNQKFYFTGDACSKVPNEIYNTYDHSVFANITVYKHPHHGDCELPSNYVEVISPKYVIVPSTKKSKAEHAYDKVGSKVYELGRKLVDTKNIIGSGDNLRGYILVETDGQTTQLIDKRY